MDEKSLMEEILGIRSKKDRGETLLFEDEAEKNPKSDEDKKKEEKRQRKRNSEKGKRRKRTVGKSKKNVKNRIRHKI